MGGLRQWARPEGNIRRPEPELHGLQHRDADRPFDEDPDVAPACEVFMPEAKQAGIRCSQ